MPLHTLEQEAEAIRAKVHGAAFVENGAKWSTVPKDNGKDRSIVLPSNGGACLTRAIGLLVEDCLARIGLDIETQPTRNRYLAYLGSIGYELATIDLSSASDRISVGLVTYLLGECPVLLRLLEACREPTAKLPGYKEPVQLEMFGTMGRLS